jgi:hypothetical protein
VDHMLLVHFSYEQDVENFQLLNARTQQMNVIVIDSKMRRQTSQLMQ